METDNILIKPKHLNTSISCYFSKKMTRSNDKTNIQISNKLWKQLNNYKLNPSDSFEKVIKNLIREREAEGELPQKKHEN
jgi:hypothetical protein